MGSVHRLVDQFEARGGDADSPLRTPRRAGVGVPPGPSPARSADGGAQEQELETLSDDPFGSPIERWPRSSRVREDASCPPAVRAASSTSTTRRPRPSPLPIFTDPFGDPPRSSPPRRGSLPSPTSPGAPSHRSSAPPRSILKPPFPITALPCPNPDPATPPATNPSPLFTAFDPPTIYTASLGTLPSASSTVVGDSPSPSSPAKRRVSFASDDDLPLLHGTASAPSTTKPYIPAHEVFQRSAPRLHLPALDVHLDAIPDADFSYLPDGEVFPPMELLPEHLTLEDLKANHVGAPKRFAWFDIQALLSTAIDGVLGGEASSFASSVIRLELITDFFQINALLLATLVNPLSSTAHSAWRKLLLGTIPNLLALNFASVLGQQIIFLFIFLALVGPGLIYFHRMMRSVDPTGGGVVEGFRVERWTKIGRWWRVGNIAVVFILTSLYLPLSKIAVDALVWSEDYWPVSNPYLDSDFPDLPPLGDPSLYREPLDFCWTTTMRKDHFNYAPLVLIAASLTVLMVTIWFPWRLYKAIERMLPHPDTFTELGSKRSKIEREQEYQRLLQADKNPFNFLYRNYRRNWGAVSTILILGWACELNDRNACDGRGVQYKAIYLVYKLTTLIITAIFSKDNCAFRQLARQPISVISQGVLLGIMTVLLISQFWASPFLDAISNNSELVSRLNYSSTALIGLLVALNVKGKDVLGGPILYVLLGLTYLMNIYFTLINTSIAHRLVKRLQKRVDFSIDLYSPLIDLSKHVKRRIWQEGISTILLASAEFKMKPDEILAFSDDDRRAPYLVGFSGSVAERHVENLKILRHVGMEAYEKAANLEKGPLGPRLESLRRTIERKFIGPDCFFIPTKATPAHTPKITTWFGNAWMLPFPLCVVIRYDQGGPPLVLSTLEDIEAYVEQNERAEIKRRRMVREAIRSLEGHELYWPHEELKLVGTRRTCPGWLTTPHSYALQQRVEVSRCVLRIGRNNAPPTNAVLPFRVHVRSDVDAQRDDVRFTSGFDITLAYSDAPTEIVIDGSAIGLDEEFRMTPLLAKFLDVNGPVVRNKLAAVQMELGDFRRYFNHCNETKRRTLSYTFLLDVYDRPLSPGKVADAVEMEDSMLIRDLPKRHAATLRFLHERRQVVSRSSASSLWFLFWDDIWRRNRMSISALPKHAKGFSPFYPTSICYRPMSRPLLEAYLTERELWDPAKPGHGFFPAGLLNRIYFTLNETVFGGTAKAMTARIADHPLPIPELEPYLTKRTHIDSSTLPTTVLGTGGGTAYDDDSIRTRPAFVWSELGEAVATEDQPSIRARVWTRMGNWARRWFGLQPFQRRGGETLGVRLGLRRTDRGFELWERNDSARTH